MSWHLSPSHTNNSQIPSISNTSIIASQISEAKPQYCLNASSNLHEIWYIVPHGGITTAHPSISNINITDSEIVAVIAVMLLKYPYRLSCNLVRISCHLSPLATAHFVIFFSIRNTKITTFQIGEAKP
jgi:hypothetical protein